MFTEPITLGSLRLEVDVVKLKHGVKPELKNFFGTYGLNADRGQFDSYEVPTGTIESIALRRGLKAMRVRGINVPLESKNPVDDFPEELLDLEDEHDVDLYEECLKAVVKHNLWLGKRAPYAMVFGPHLPPSEQKNPELLLGEDSEEKVGETVAEDPTPSEPATFGERLMSGSDMVSGGAS